MKIFKQTALRAGALFLVFTLLCGGAYTLAVTGLSQLLFPEKANGSIIEADGKKYGCELLAQPFLDDTHLWGRIMNVDVSTYTDDAGNPVLYAGPSNKSPASPEYEQMVAQRVAMIRAAHPEKGDAPIPVDLVTVSGSGLDPHISPAAAEYQVARLAHTTGKSEQAIRQIIESCTTGRFLGLFGEPRVNVLEVNLTLDGILQ